MNDPSASSRLKAACTPSWWAARTRSWAGRSGAEAHSTDTDLGAEKVRSYPATLLRSPARTIFCSVFSHRSRAASLCAARLSASRSGLSPAALSAAARVAKSSAAHRSCSSRARTSRSCTVAYTRNLDPRRSPVTGSHLAPKNPAICCSLTSRSVTPKSSRCAPSHHPFASPGSVPPRM